MKTNNKQVSYFLWSRPWKSAWERRSRVCER